MNSTEFQFCILHNNSTNIVKSPLFGKVSGTLIYSMTIRMNLETSES